MGWCSRWRRRRF